jgi:hypothetical protein
MVLAYNFSRAKTQVKRGIIMAEILLSPDELI